MEPIDPIRSADPPGLRPGRVHQSNPTTPRLPEAEPPTMTTVPRRTSPPRSRRLRLPALALVLALAAVEGCGTVKTTGTARSGTEQLLLTNAWDSALQKVDFRPLTGVPVYLDTTNVSAVDQGWVVSSLRQS